MGRFEAIDAAPRVPASSFATVFGFHRFGRERERNCSINRIYVCYDEFEEGFENLEAAWLDVSRVTYFMADDKEGAWRFLDDDDDEIEALDDPAPEDLAAMDLGDNDDDDDDMDEDDD